MQQLKFSKTLTWLQKANTWRCAISGKCRQMCRTISWAVCPLLDKSQRSCWSHGSRTILSSTVCHCLRGWSGCTSLLVHSSWKHGSSERKNRCGFRFVPRLPAPSCFVLFTHLIPLLLVPLRKGDDLRSKCLDGFLSSIQQLYSDFILAAAVPSWRIPNVTHTHTNALAWALRSGVSD